MIEKRIYFIKKPLDKQVIFFIEYASDFQKTMIVSVISIHLTRTVNNKYQNKYTKGIILIKIFIFMLRIG